MTLDDLTHVLNSAGVLPHSQIEVAIQALVDPHVTDADKAAFLLALKRKGETEDDIAGFAEALLRRAVIPSIEAAKLPGPLVDLCGTGGDKAGLFNVSTTCMFVVAAAGATVVKHGNRAITSQSGGADVLEELGVHITVPPEKVSQCLEQVGAAFIFAPLYHPAFKAIGPVRKQLASEGHTTIFNILGPLLNPLKPPFQLVGLFSGELQTKYAHALRLLGRERAWVIHGEGLDEMTTTGLNTVMEVRGKSAIHSEVVDPLLHGLPRATVPELQGGDRQTNAAILLGILRNELHGPKRDIVLLNSGAALHVTGLAADLHAGIALAAEQLESGAALAKLEALRTVSAQLAA